MAGKPNSYMKGEKNRMKNIQCTNIFKGVDADKPFSWSELNRYGKIAYIGSWKDGLSDRRPYRELVDHPLYQHILEFVDLYEDLEKEELEKYCAIVIPAMVDEIYLHRCKNRIRTYLDNGGVILSFMQNFTGILPNNKGYRASQAAIKDREVYFAKGESARLIFEGVREYDMNIRRGVKGFFNRGYFELDQFGEENIPEILLEDNEGKCVAYIDRTSTNGIILAAAASDLLGFGTFENNTARRIGPNLLEWLGEELKKKDYHQLRKERKFTEDALNTDKVFDYGRRQENKRALKNAIITGGMAFHQKFFQNKDGKYADFFTTRVYLADMEDFCFEDYDYVVLASNLNARFLAPHKEKMIAYLEKGGHIVSLGDSMQEYLPNINWKSYPTNFWWWRFEGADMPLYAVESQDGGKTWIKQERRTREGLFSKIDVSVAKWHCHGAFYPPTNSCSILVNELDEAIIYKDLNFKGNLYVMSLDPDYHFGQGFMPTTEPFLDALLEWVEEDIFVKG